MMETPPPLPRSAEPRKRLLAKAVDFSAALILSLALGTVAELGFFAWVPVVLSLDLLSRNSLGKRFLSLRIVSRRDENEASRWACFLRNTPFVFCVLPLLFPPTGWVVAVFFLPLFLVLETMLVLFHGRSLRLGDYLANTRVVQLPPSFEPSSLEFTRPD
jgi:uncharacterized RDD family membrane protein YckC